MFFTYTFDNNLIALYEQKEQLNILVEEIRMHRNYSESNKIQSNNYITSFTSIHSIVQNPLQFILLFMYKNESLNLINKQDEGKLIEFISYCSKKENYANIKNIEVKMMKLFKMNTPAANMTIDMLTTIIRRHQFDSFLYRSKLIQVLQDWYKINNFVLQQKLKISDSDIDKVVDFIQLYKLSEILYV
jgi:hypothetical protein